MSAFHLTVNVDNAAFDPDPRPELARILRDVAERVESGEHIGHYLTVLDVNGNDVGWFAIKNEDGSCWNDVAGSGMRHGETVDSDDREGWATEEERNAGTFLST